MSSYTPSKFLAALFIGGVCWAIFDLALTPIWGYGTPGTDWSFFNGFWRLGVPIIITICSGIWLTIQGLAQRKLAGG